MKSLQSFLADTRIKRLLVLNVFNALGFIVLNGGLRLGVFPYLSRILGPQQFGEFLTAYSIASSVCFLAGNVMMTTMVRLHAGFESQQKQVFFNTITVSIFALGPLLAVLFLAMSYGLNGFFAKVDLLLFAWPLAIYLCTFFVELMINNILGCQARYIAKSLYDAAAGILCLCVFPLGYFYGKTAAVYSLAVAFGLVSMAQLVRLSRSFGQGMSVDYRYMWNIFSIAPFYMGTYLLDLLFQYGQRWLLAYYLDAEAVSVFFIGTTVALILMMAIGMVSQLETLMISQRAAVTDLRWSEVKLLVTGCVVLSIGLPILAFFINTPLNIILYGEEMAFRGAQVSYIILPMLVFAPPLMVFRPIVVKFCSPKVPLAFSIIIACFAVGLGIIFVRQWGLTGAAWATVLTTVLSAVLFGWKFITRILIPVRCHSTA